MRNTSKKVLALTLTVAMLLSCMVFSFGASAAVVKMWENHFENGSATNWASAYTGNNENGHYNSGRVGNTGGFYNYAVPKTDSDNTFMALGWGNDLAHQRISGFIVLHEGTTNNVAANKGTYGHAGKYRYTSLPQGSFQPDSGNYAIKLDYKVPQITDGGAIDVYVCFSGAFWSDDRTKSYLDNNVQSVYQKMFTVTPDDMGKGWQTITHMVQLDVPDGQYWYMHIFARTDNLELSLNGSEVWIDNIEVSSYTDASDFPSISIYYGDEQLHTSRGVAGMPYTMPTLEGLPANAEISYYTDAALTQPLEALPTVYPAESMNIYVKAEKYLANDPWGFESETAGASVASNNTTYGDYVISNEAAHSGTQSLKLDCSKGYATDTTAHTTQFMLKNGSGDFAAVEIGKTYLISYWVMVPETMSSFNNSLWLVADPSQTGSYSFSGNIYNSYNKIFRNNGVSYVTVPNDGQWHQIVYKIDGANIGKIANGKTYGYGNVLVGLSGNTATPGLSVYVDDMDLICIDDLVAEGTDRQQYQFGEDVTVDGETKLTHLHKYVGDKDNMTGAYTSIRLGGTYTAGSAAGDSIVLGGVALPLNARGIIMDTKDNASTMTADTATWKSSKTGDFGTAWEIADAADGKQMTYTLRLANISKTLAQADTEYQYRTYYKITLPKYYAESGTSAVVENTQVTVYGGLSDAFTLHTFYDNLVNDDNPANDGIWFE